MPNEEKDFSVNKIKEEYNFIEKSSFYTIFKEFDLPCKPNNKYYDGGVSCYKHPQGKLTINDDVDALLKDLYSILYRVYYTIDRTGNDYFDQNQEEVKQMGCIYLKYWLYDQITTKGFTESQVTTFFDGINNHIKGRIDSFNKDHCNFNKLSLDEMKRLKKLYAFNTILYTGDKNSENCNNNECNYMDYFEEALLEFINTIKNCSTNSSENEYCNEFKDFLQICNENNTYAGIAVYTNYKGSIDYTRKKYLFFAEKYENQQLYAYIKDNTWLNWSKIDHIVNPQKRTTIAATSVVGSAIGLSSIFYYLYKFTPFGSSLRKGKNVVNIEEKAHDSLLYTSDTEQAPFKSRKYNVAYHTFSDN
ncbi:hypothetical protein PVNG_01546 [Plasmodium vivax North Korean]|uniref:VIR protein n=1 Tax=Plasmodium vivax North Korean TaxID=1035514 RepID=A0A0J9U2X8_PLAVI|nr:hypothetical protein PVNG_01546 [Plasmodium vivax North Korean]